METINALQQIGFTEYEAKTYLALLKDNPATGYQISKDSGVPRSMVYEVLSRLHSRGAVLETIEGRTTYYRPLPPGVLLDQHNEKIDKILSNLRPVLSSYFESKVDDRVWTIIDKNAIYAYSDQMLHQAEEEVYLVSNDQSLEVFEDTLKILANKNLKLNLLLTGTREFPHGNIAYHPPLESEIQGLKDTLLVLIDNKEVLVASTSSDSRATITANANLILIAKQFVWMEFFTQRIYKKLGGDLLNRLDPEDREILESMIQLN